MKLFTSPEDKSSGCSASDESDSPDPREHSIACAGGIVNLSARLESQTKEIKKPIAIDEAACRDLNGSLQIETPGRKIFKS